MRIVPVFGSICRSAARNVPGRRDTRCRRRASASGRRRSSRAILTGVACVDLLGDAADTPARSARSRRGSDRPATPSSSSVVGPTRSPICAVAIAAMPSTSERTFVKLEIQPRGVDRRLARPSPRPARPGCAWMSLSSWLCAIARSFASGVSRCDVALGASELRAAPARAAPRPAPAPPRTAAASISNSTSPFRTTAPSR